VTAETALVAGFVIAVVSLVAAAVGLALVGRANRRAVEEQAARRRAIFDPDWPPGVTFQEAALLADRDGTSVDAAARAIFRARGRALLDAQLRRHHGNPRPSPPDAHDGEG
jgi:hypothetical protein